MKGPEDDQILVETCCLYFDLINYNKVVLLMAIK